MRDHDRLRIGEMARLAGVSPDTIRHYEKIGVLPHPQRTNSGYRQFSAANLDRVRLIRHALAMGFSLAELKQVLCIRDAGEAPCRRVRALARVKLRHVREEIAELTLLRDRMEEILRSWNRKLSRTPRGARAELLESLKHFSIRPSSRRKFK
jgi:DNA-binding transcriptional MerR regulator